MTYAPYYPSGWDDSPATSTPIVAAALDVMDAGISAATVSVNGQAAVDGAVTLSAADVGAASTGALASEATTRANADSALSTAIGNEVTRAEGAESTLSTAISAETTRAEAAEALALPKAGGTMTGWIAPAVATLTDGSSVALNAALGNDFRWTLGGSSHTLAAPSNPVNGMSITIAIKYSGSYTPLFNSVFDFGAAGQPSWSAASGKTDYAGFRYDSALNAGAGEWAYMGSVLGLTS